MPYIPNEDLNLSFYKEEIITILDLWHRGVALEEIASILNRDSDEIGFLLCDIADIYPNNVPVRSNGLEASVPIGKFHRFNCNLKYLFKEIEPDGLYRPFTKKNINFFWEEYEVLKFEKTFQEKKCFIDLINEFNRNALEILYLLVDRVRKGKIVCDNWRLSHG